MGDMFWLSEALIEAVAEGALVIAYRAVDSDRPHRAIDARGAEHPAQGKPASEELLQPRALPKPQRHRAYGLPAEGPQAHSNQRRPPRRNPRPKVDRRSHRRHRRILVVSRDPKSAV